MPAESDASDLLAADAVPLPSIDADAQPSLSAVTCAHPETGAKLLLVEFRSGEAVGLHPEVTPLLSQGWRVRSAVPRIVEGEGLKLLVSLTQSGVPPTRRALKQTSPRTASSLALNGKA